MAQSYQPQIFRKIFGTENFIVYRGKIIGEMFLTNADAILTFFYCDIPKMFGESEDYLDRLHCLMQSFLGQYS